MQRPEHEVVVIGQYCEALMRNDIFNDLYKEFHDTAVERLLATEPHEIKKREHEYARISVLRDFLLLMASYAESGTKITALAASDQYPDPEASDDETES